MGVPAAEFRRLDISESEPTNRTTAGVVVSTENILDFGVVNNSSGSAQIGPVCLIYRITNLNGNSKVDDLKFAVTCRNSIGSGNKIYIKISDTWIQNITFEEAAAGPPGLCPEGFPSQANIQKIGGGAIEDTDHANTSQYIYLAAIISENESAGEKEGIRFGIKANYYES